MPKTKPEAQPDAERGERIETGKTIARGGKSTGAVPGASSGASSGATSDSGKVLSDPSGQPEVPDESLSPDNQKRRAVAHAVAQLGEDADSKEIADVCRAQSGIELSAGEAAALATSLKTS